MSKSFRELKQKFESKKNIVRVQKNKENPYVMINKSCLNDANLSWAAKGLHSYLLSLPDDWEIYVDELVKHTSAGRDHTYRVVNELLEHGYMEKVQYRCEGKILGLNYTVFEVSTGENNTKAKISNVTLSDNGEIVEISTIQPNTENQDTDSPDTDFTTLLNNNNYEVIKEIKNKEVVVVVDEKQTQLLEMYKSFKLEKRVMPHTINLLKQYTDKFDLEVFEQIFISASDDSVKKKYAYMKTILEELDKKNIKTLVEYEKDNESFRASKTTKKSNTTSTGNKDYKVKTRFHNINDRTKNYTPEELEKLLKENQKRKFAKEEAVRKKGNSFHNFTQTIDKYAEEELNDIIAKSQKYKYGEVTPIEVTEELINKCMLDKDYFESLDMTTKYAVKDYIKNKGRFIPSHLM